MERREHVFKKIILKTPDPVDTADVFKDLESRGILNGGNGFDENTEKFPGEDKSAKKRWGKLRKTVVVAGMLKGEARMEAR